MKTKLWTRVFNNSQSLISLQYQWTHLWLDKWNTETIIHVIAKASPHYWITHKHLHRQGYARSTMCLSQVLKRGRKKDLTTHHRQWSSHQNQFAIQNNTSTILHSVQTIKAQKSRKLLPFWIPKQRSWQQKQPWSEWNNWIEKKQNICYLTRHNASMR